MKKRFYFILASLLFYSTLVFGGEDTCAFTIGYAYFLRYGTYISIPSNSFFDHSEFSFCLWLKSGSVASAKQGLMGSEVLPTVTRKISENAGLQLNEKEVYFYVGSDFNRFSLHYPITPGTWTHIAATFSFSEHNGTARLYTNGRLRSTLTGIGCCNVVEREFSVGRYSGNDDDDRLTGLVDEVQVWSRALSESEVFLASRSQAGSGDTDLRLIFVAEENQIRSLLCAAISSMPSENRFFFNSTSERDTAFTAHDHSSLGNNGKFVSDSHFDPLTFIYFEPDCIGCFSKTYPRCTPHNSKDICGDKLTTGDEQCDFSNNNNLLTTTYSNCSSINCKCIISTSQPTANGDCSMKKSLCTYDAVSYCSFVEISCGLSCDCYRSFLTCMQLVGCTLDDFKVFTDILWSGCMFYCGNTSSTCWDHVPDACLKNSDKATCESFSSSSCQWCNNHCIKSNIPCLPLCGNKNIENGEVCDDGNDVSGDGCSSDCSEIETGYNCSIIGELCFPICGDSLTISPEETCDDGNIYDEDGCSNKCLIEDGWTCQNNTSPSKCTPIEKSINIIAVVVPIACFIVIVIIVMIIISVVTRKSKATAVYTEVPSVTPVEIVMHNMVRPIPRAVKHYDLTGSSLISIREFPLEMKPIALRFGLSDTERAPVDTPISDTLILRNKTSFPYFFQVCSEETNKYIFSAPTRTEALGPGEQTSIELQLTVLCTTKINANFNVMASQTSVTDPEASKMHVKLTIITQSKLSTKLDPDELQLIEPPIGDGSFGTVYRGRYHSEDVAVKVLKFQDFGDKKKDFEREVRIMEGLRSPFIVGFIGAVTIPGRLCLVTEFLPFGSLQHLLGTEQLNESLKVRVCLDSAKGMAYLHGSKIIHRDIKPDNIMMVSFDHNAMVVCKITDFGTTREVGEEVTKTYSKAIGTPLHMAPELLDNEKRPYSMAADVFSFGVLMYQVFVEKDIYKNEEFKRPWQIAKFVLKGNRLPIPELLDMRIASIIQRCWAQRMEERPAFEEVVKLLSALTKPRRTTILTNNPLIGGLFNRNNRNQQGIELQQQGSSSSSSAIPPPPLVAGAHRSKNKGKGKSPETEHLHDPV